MSSSDEQHENVQEDKPSRKRGAIPSSPSEIAKIPSYLSNSAPPESKDEEEQ